jgi:hypothetical protein
VKHPIKAFLAAGLLALSLFGCGRDQQQSDDHIAAAAGPHDPTASVAAAAPALAVPAAPALPDTTNWQVIDASDGLTEWLSPITQSGDVSSFTVKSMADNSNGNYGLTPYDVQCAAGLTRFGQVMLVHSDGEAVAIGQPVGWAPNQNARSSVMQHVCPNTPVAAPALVATLDRSAAISMARNCVNDLYRHRGPGQSAEDNNLQYMAGGCGKYLTRAGIPKVQGVPLIQGMVAAANPELVAKCVNEVAAEDENAGSGLSLAEGLAEGEHECSVETQIRNAQMHEYVTSAAYVQRCLDDAKSQEAARWPRINAQDDPTQDPLVQQTIEHDAERFCSDNIENARKAGNWPAANAQGGN